MKTSLKKVIEGGTRRMFAIAREELAGAAPEFAASAQANVQRMGLVKTGNLRDSIRARADKRSLKVGSETPYGNIYNFGGKVTQSRTGQAQRAWEVKRRTWASTELFQAQLQRVATRVAQRVR